MIEVNEPEQASEAIARAFHVAESGTQGPVAVILPEDIFDEETDAEVDAARDRPIAGPRVDDLDRLAEMLANSERPLVPVGGALWADHLRDPSALADLNRLAEEWVLPINPTHRRPHLFDALHPNYGGYMGIRVPPALIGEMKKADLMVALGERMTDSVSQSYTFPAAPTPQLPFVHVWPDANEVGRVWRPTLGLPCSPHEVIKALLARGTPPDAAKRRGWVAGLNAIHRQLLAKEWNPTSDGINFAAIVCEVDKHLAGHFQLLRSAHCPILRHRLQTLTGVRHISDSQLWQARFGELGRKPPLRFVKFAKDNLFGRDTSQLCGQAHFRQSPDDPLCGIELPRLDAIAIVVLKLVMIVMVSLSKRH